MYLQLTIFVLAIFGLNLFKDNNPYTRDRMRKKYIVFMMTLLFLQSGLRNLAVGADTYAYFSVFYSDLNNSWSSLFTSWTSGQLKDVGYHFISKIFGLIIPDFRCFLIAISALFFYSLGSLLKKYLKTNMEVLVAIALYECLYYSFFSITGLRQTIATAILLISVKFVIDRKLMKFLFFLLIAVTIHKSAILFVLFYFLNSFRNNRIIFLVAFFLFIPMFFLGNFIADILKDTTLGSYAHYLKRSDIAGAYVFIVYIVLLMFITYAKLKTINGLSNDNSLFASSIAIAMLLSPLLMLDPNNQRVVQYYSIFSLIILPKICTVYSQRFFSRKILGILVFSVLVLYTLSRCDEYKFFWQDMLFVGNSGSFILNESNAIQFM